MFVCKLDGVGPIDNNTLITDPPPISFTTLSEEKNIIIIVTCDT